GVRADPEKIEAICTWPPPKDQKQLRQWIGLRTYLYHYSRNFAATLRPLSQSLKGDATWSWRSEHQDDFDAVKTSLSTTPVLMLADHTKPFHVVCDSSDFAIGCALMQFDDEGRERVVSYQSRQLKPAERNYPVHDNEPLAMRYALIKFGVYLLGEQTFAVYTDHGQRRRSIALDDNLRARLIHEFHDTPSGGHLRRENTFASLSRDFYWSHMYEWVWKWVHSCEAYQRVKPNPWKQAPLRPLPVSPHPWSSVSMDFGFGLPRDTQGRTGTLVFVDRFNKMVHLPPVSVNITAEQSSAIFVDIVYQHHGLPISIVSDRDSRLLRSFATSFKSWSSFLLMVEFAMNNAVHASTGLTPFYVNYGRHPRVPALLGVERSDTTNEVDVEDADGSAFQTLRPTTNGQVPRGSVSAIDESRESAHDAVNSVTTRHAARAVAQGVRTRAAARAALEEAAGGTTRDRVATRATPTSRIAAWSSRTLINPRQRRSGIEYQDVSDAAETPVLTQVNFNPVPVPQPRDSAAVNKFVQEREFVVGYMRDAIAAAVDRPNEYADRQGRKNLEKFAVGDRVLLSTAGIQSAAVTNLGANKLASRFIRPFQVTKVLGDAYTQRLPTALRLHPTSYVGRLRRYHRATIHSDANNPPAAPRPTAAGAAAHGSPPPTSPCEAQDDPGAVRVQRPQIDHTPYQRDGPAPVVDRAGQVRHIVEEIVQHDDERAAPRGLK
ncbi:polyprotein, partial [Phytophthora megakarya]